MSPEFRNHERYVPSPTWEEWRKDAREQFTDSFHSSATKEQIDHEWDEEFFAIQFENGLAAKAAVKMYFDDRNIDDNQNEPL